MCGGYTGEFDMEVEKIDLYEVSPTYGEGAVQYIYKFLNGYGASVVRHNSSMGNNKGLYELAVLDKDGRLCYDTPITNDVIGSLKFEEAEDICYKISQLTTEEVDEFKKEKE